MHSFSRSIDYAAEKRNLGFSENLFNFWAIFTEFHTITPFDNSDRLFILQIQLNSEQGCDKNRLFQQGCRGHPRHMYDLKESIKNRHLFTQSCMPSFESRVFLARFYVSSLQSGIFIALQKNFCMTPTSTMLFR